MLRVEAKNAAVPVERKPEWMRTKVKMGPEFAAMKKRVGGSGLHTVCEEAGCPNIFECWEDREATFLIGGSACTRRCDFCEIDTGHPRRSMRWSRSRWHDRSPKCSSGTRR